jgi:hypothetical protein
VKWLRRCWRMMNKKRPYMLGKSSEPRPIVGPGSTKEEWAAWFNMQIKERKKERN